MLKLEFIDGLPKYLQIVNGVKKVIDTGQISEGDPLPSVAQLCKDYKLSKDTVFKAYSRLKQESIIYSIPNKGYYIAGEGQRVLVLIDTFKAYKEVFHQALSKNIDEGVKIDLHFHHYNIDHFKRIISDSVGLYSKYIIMPFDHDEVATSLNLIPDHKLLVIDWNIQNSATNVVAQDFDKGLTESLESLLPKIDRYKHFTFIYPPFTYHPTVSKIAFMQFCKNHNIDGTIEECSPDKLDINSETAYLTVSDRILGEILEQSISKKLKIGKDVGIISYNETPMKKFVRDGITVISIDFKKLGEAAAQFANQGDPTDRVIKTEAIVRESL